MFSTFAFEILLNLLTHKNWDFYFCSDLLYQIRMIIFPTVTFPNLLQNHVKIIQKNVEP